MDAWLKQRRGPQAKLWQMVNEEVYAPSGIYHAVKFHTLENDAASALPLTDAGLLLSLDNVARLGQLLHSGGRVEDRSILHQPMLQEVFDPRRKKGLATGTHTVDGEVYYHAGVWHLPYKARSGVEYWLPTMRGYGGQTIQLLPNGMTAFRFAHDSYATEERFDALIYARIADQLKPF